uniref:Neutral ceramidase n=1 Tax=Macrostomum lignano TaxID=282301 RepID=A0A1I8JCZ5_9PLAT
MTCRSQLSAWLCLISFGLLSLFSTGCGASGGGLMAGVGVADITGPAGEVPMMGYAKASQKTAGIHIRLFARAFVFRDRFGATVAYVNVDAAMVSQMVKLRVLEILKKKFGNTYTEKNVLLSAIHTHSGPGGFHGYTLYAISTLGYMSDTFEAFSNGIASSIEQAHLSLRPARLFYNEGELNDSSVSRSPSSYLLNPAAERARYSGDVDRTMQLLKLVDGSTGEPFGMLNWFPVHCTSLNNTNQMISGDNKGWAAQLFERYMSRGAQLPGKQKFVAAFSNANEGDVSPNTAGPRCIDTGEPCDILTSTCGGRTQKCVAFGPGRDMMDSARIIGQRQFNKALSLFQSATREVQVDSISVVHQNVDMTNYELTVSGKRVRTCKPAMGFSFAAGTTDGPGGFDFTQGDTSGNLFWNIVRSVLSKPSAEQVDCQKPKPILLNTGYMSFPTQWQPSVVETQLVRIGPLTLVALPGEFTTMSGRRVRDAVRAALEQNGMPDGTVILAGLSNLYSSYIATYEEYQAQRYEAASTIYGPHTLSAYVDQFGKLARALATNASVDSGPPVPNLYNKIKSYSFITPIVYDSVGIGRNFGDVVTQPKVAYRPGDTVSASFRTGHPRNNMMLGGSFMMVQRKNSSGDWEEICNDACVETRFRWQRTNALLGHSLAHLDWDIPSCARPGTYRLLHTGWYKPVLLWQKPRQFSGATREFQVKSSSARQATGQVRDVINDMFGSGCN